MVSVDRDLIALQMRNWLKSADNLYYHEKKRNFVMNVWMKLCYLSEYLCCFRESLYSASANPLNGRESVKIHYSSSSAVRLR